LAPRTGGAPRHAGQGSNIAVRDGFENRHGLFVLMSVCAALLLAFVFRNFCAPDFSSTSQIELPPIVVADAIPIIYASQ